MAPDPNWAAGYDNSTAKGRQVLDLLGISQFSTLRWSFFQDVMKFSAAGCGGIGLWREKVDEIGVDEAVDLLFEMKLQVSSLGWCGGFTGNNGGSFAAQVDDALEAIQMAAALRANCLIVQPGSINGHIRRHAGRLLDEAFRILVPVATDYGIRLVLEPMPACCWTWLAGLEETRQFCDRFPSENVGLIWDLGLLDGDPRAWESVPNLLDRIAVVQLAEPPASRNGSLRPGWNQSVPRLREWIRHLRRAGYRGPWEIEHPPLGSDRGHSAKALQDLVQQVGIWTAAARTNWPSSR